MRQLDLNNGKRLTVIEGTHLADEAGAVLWDAGLVLINGFLDHQVAIKGASVVEGKRVLELGAGTGACGLAAAALGASHVALTDLPRLLPLLQQNVAANPQLASRVAVAPLTWGDDEAVTALHPPVDVVLASDCLYQAEALQPFLATLHALSGPQTLTLLSLEHRQALPFPEAAFQTAGFDVRRLSAAELDPDWSADDIHVYQIRLRQQL